MQASLGLKRFGGPLGFSNPEGNGPIGASAFPPLEARGRDCLWAQPGSQGFMAGARSWSWLGLGGGTVGERRGQDLLMDGVWV